MTRTILSLSVLLACGAASASTTPEYNAEKLAFLKSRSLGTSWACRKGDNPAAVSVIKVDSEGSRRISRDTALVIEDQQICDQLRVVCPFVAGAYPHRFEDRLHRFWATLGKYEDTVAFHSEGSGMKLQGVSNGSQATFPADWSWYFNEGECRKLD